MYIAIRTDDGRNIGKISFYCSTLQVSRQAFYDYLGRKGKPCKYQPLADAMLKIHDEDEENADYGRVRMYQALKYAPFHRGGLAFAVEARSAWKHS